MIKKLIATALAAGALFAAAPSPAEAAPVAVRAATINICGDKCNGGRTTNTTGLVYSAVIKSNLDVVGTQETCWNQYVAIAKKLAPLGFQSRFTTATTATTCGPAGSAADRYGNAIFVRTSGDISGRTYTDLPNPSNKQARRIMCLSAPVRGAQIRTCVTHLDYTALGNAAQAKFVADYMAKQTVAYRYVIFLADVNFEQQTTSKQALLEKSMDGIAPYGSIDRVMEKGGTTAARVSYLDSRTDHPVMVASFRFGS